MSDEDDPFLVLMRLLLNGLELKQFSSNHDFSENRETRTFLESQLAGKFNINSGLTQRVKVKVKQSRYRLGVAQRVPGN